MEKLTDKEFNISIYNPDIGMNKQLENQIKAAYLYGDSVTLYDFSVLSGEQVFSESDLSEYNKHRNYIFSVNRYYLEYMEEGYSIDQLREELPIESVRWLENEAIPWYYSYIKGDGPISQLFSRFNFNNTTTSDDIELVSELEKQFLNSKSFRMISGNYLSLNKTNAFTDKSVSFANNILDQIPAFSMASIDEIVDIKRELAKYISSFRSAMFKYSLYTQQIPGTPEYNRECEQLYISIIRPQILEIQEAIRDNKVFKNICSNIAVDESTWKTVGALGSTIAINLIPKSTMIDYLANTSANQLLAELSRLLVAEGTIASAGLAVAYGGKIISNAIKNYYEKRDEIEKRELYFLYKLDKN